MCSHFKNSSWECSREVGTTLRKNGSVNKASIHTHPVPGEAQGPKNRQRSVLNHTALHRICNDCYKPSQASGKHTTGGPLPTYFSDQLLLRFKIQLGFEEGSWLCCHVSSLSR